MKCWRKERAATPDRKLIVLMRPPIDATDRELDKWIDELLCAVDQRTQNSLIPYDQQSGDRKALVLIHLFRMHAVHMG